MNLFIGFPVLGSVAPQTAVSMTMLGAVLERAKIPFWIEGVFSDPYLPRARNTLAAVFRGAKEYDRLLFIDSDIAFDPEDVLRLLENEVDIVAADYNRKKPGAGLAATRLPCQEGHLQEALLAPTGFMSISRAAIERMCESYIETSYCPDSVSGSVGGEIHQALFTGECVDGRFAIDDETFCRRWRRIGGRLWIDTRIKLGHVGTFVY
jgi:hypothetical protein